MRNVPLENQTNSFFLSFGRGVYVFEEKPNSIQDFIGDVYCPVKYCLNREKNESIGGYVTTPRSIYRYESVEPGCLFKKFLSRYKSTSRRQKQTKHGFSSLKTLNLVPFLSSSYDSKKCKACCHVLIIPFTDQKLTTMLFGRDGTHCSHESRLQ